MTQSSDLPSETGANAEDTLEHALRERPVVDDAFDDGADTAEGAPASADVGTPDDAEDYVLYSEVRPHLEALVQLQGERDKMIDILLYARDRVSSPAVAARMDDNLAELGIRVIVPRAGDRFDTKQHEASATVPTDDGDLHGTLAEVELAGYADGDRVVRHPVVTVYTTERAPA